MVIFTRVVKKVSLIDNSVRKLVEISFDNKQHVILNPKLNYKAFVLIFSTSKPIIFMGSSCPYNDLFGNKVKFMTVKIIYC